MLLLIVLSVMVEGQHTPLPVLLLIVLSVMVVKSTRANVGTRRGNAPGCVSGNDRISDIDG